MAEFVDITPSPRILRTLGEIPFASWQCLAELIDNSLDGFAHAQSLNMELGEKRIIVSWSSGDVGTNASSIEVTDTGPGMDPNTLQNCVRAGFTNNDPINNLGLFGMGFNIATARLGEKTVILSATRESKEWIGIEIDFDALTAEKAFRAPLVKDRKKRPDEHGTKVIVSKLRPGNLAELRAHESPIRKRLGQIYSTILDSRDIEIRVQSRILTPRKHCVWSPERYVQTKGGQKVYAIQEIDESIGGALFDVNRNRYLTADEEVEALEHKEKKKKLPPGIVERQKRIHGWIGIQRYSDPYDYGIDFIRNGRKIIIGDKSLFSYVHPITGQQMPEYPVELGTTTGGRIVGEVHIDHVPPTYQKNDFDRSDKSWREVVEFLRGEGPIRPKDRKLMGLADENISFLGKLIGSPFARPESGTRHVFAPNAFAKAWAEKFHAGDPEYHNDEKWWEAAKEEDRRKADKGASGAADVDRGGTPSDDITKYGPGTAAGAPSATQTIETAQATSVERDRMTTEDPAILRTRSREIRSYSGDYAYANGSHPIKVRVLEVVEGSIGSVNGGAPCKMVSDGVESDFFYNPNHPLFVNFQVEVRDLLLLYLVDRFKARDNNNNLNEIYSGLLESKFPESRIDSALLAERAKNIFERVREKATESLAVREQEVIDFVHESSGEVEEIMSKLIDNSALLEKFQSRKTGAIDALLVAPVKTLVRLMDKFPEEFLDSKVFKTPFASIRVPDDKMTERLRESAKDKVLSLVKDAARAIGETPAWATLERQKDELVRRHHSLTFLEQECCE